MSIIQNMSINNFIFDFDKREDYSLIINNNNTTTNNEKIFYIKVISGGRRLQFRQLQ
jgi:hypothetical protein